MWQCVFQELQTKPWNELYHSRLEVEGPIWWRHTMWNGGGKEETMMLNNRWLHKLTFRDVIVVVVVKVNITLIFWKLCRSNVEKVLNQKLIWHDHKYNFEPWQIDFNYSCMTKSSKSKFKIIQRNNLKSFS